MDRILTELKSTKASTISENEKENVFVIREAVRSSAGRPATSKAISKTSASQKHSTNLTTGDDFLQCLRSEPEIETLQALLQQLDSDAGRAILNVQLPGPTQAQLIHTLVNSVLPSFWQLLESSDQRLCARILTSISGINAVLAGLRRLLSDKPKTIEAGNYASRVVELLQLLDAILQGDHIISNLWSGLDPLAQDRVKHTLAWKEAVNLLGSGKIISIQTEAYESIRHANEVKAIQRTSGSAYASWLARNIIKLAARGQSEDVSAGSQILSKALSLGYTQEMIAILVRSGTEEAGNPDYDNTTILSSLLANLTTSNKRRVIQDLLIWLSSIFNQSHSHIHTTAIPEIAGLFLALSNDTVTRQQLIAVICEPAALASVSLVVRQAALIALTERSTSDLTSSLEKTLSIFGDQLFIDHAPIMQQEALAQNILWSAGLLYDKRPTALVVALRAASHMQGVSNRLACSSTRARWLGMIVGTAMSRLVDKPSAQMNFGTPDMETTEATTWLSMTHAQYTIGKLKDLNQMIDQTSQRQKDRSSARIKHAKSIELPTINGKQTFGPPRPPALAQTEIQGQRVTELADDDLDEDDDLKPYAKPDSDPEDSDEDATLVNRDKPRPPIYIRSLMSMLRDSEKADRFQMAVKHAAPLIRRKTGFGREVIDHAEELARLLANLQDPFETDNFDELRLQAMIAVVLSDVPTIAPWLSRQAFLKDYSIAQRAIMLTALGLAGREMAGFKQEDELNQSFDNTSFPSKRLPARLHATYDQNSSSTKLLDSTTQRVEQSMIQPMALAAADQTTSHLDAVKVRKFSSRMDVQRTKRKPTTNELGKVFNVAFFQPLLGSFQQQYSVLGNASTHLSAATVLATYLKTLAILLHASGPTTLELPQITTEFWELLLFLRTKAIGDVTIMEALLFCFLTILETNEDKHALAMNTPKQLMETKEWVEMVFERTGGGTLIEGEGEEARVRALCAGILTKTGDIIAAYQKVLMGSWFDT